jgi:hypothetical protein
MVLIENHLHSRYQQKAFHWSVMLTTNSAFCSAFSPLATFFKSLTLDSTQLRSFPSRVLGGCCLEDQRTFTLSVFWSITEILRIWVGFMDIATLRRTLQISASAFLTAIVSYFKSCSEDTVTIDCGVTMMSLKLMQSPVKFLPKLMRFYPFIW